jgi:anionic cell wall polymer biosynthesis LytR-Cps2A-Psr (LCP) family protein
VNIDPDFSTAVFQKKQVKLRSMLANAEAEQETGIEYLTTAVQSMLAIRIDRYVTINKDKLANFFLENKVTYTTTDAVSDPEAGNFAANKQVMGSEIIKYLAADSTGNEAKGARIGKFMQTIIPRYLSLGGMVTSYLNLEKVGSLFETNMQKQEIWELAVNLLNRGSMQYAYISTQQYGRIVESRLGGYYSADILTIDAKVQELLTRSRVAREQGRIEIFNATKTAGLATAAKRQLTNQGANIIRAGNSPELSERSKLYVEDVEKFSANISLIREILRDDILLIEEPYPLNHTGDMVLILGGSEED